MPIEIDRINREHVEAFIADQLEKWRPKTAHVRYGDLRQFFRWAVEDGEITSSPMANMHSADGAGGARSCRVRRRSEEVAEDHRGQGVREAS